MSPTDTDDLGPKPDAQIEPGEPNPGGADAVDGGDPAGEPTVPDLSPDLNPETEGSAVPDEVREGEDTSTEATEDEPVAGESDTHDETPE
jgi:hypothetical protein